MFHVGLRKESPMRENRIIGLPCGGQTDRTVEMVKAKASLIIGRRYGGQKTGQTVVKAKAKAMVALVAGIIIITMTKGDSVMVTMTTMDLAVTVIQTLMMVMKMMMDGVISERLLKLSKVQVSLQPDQE